MPVEEALAAILAKITPVETELIPLTQGLGRVLAKPVVSSLNVPPFVNSAMDGYAVIAGATTTASPEAPVRLNVVANIPAGSAASAELTAVSPDWLITNSASLSASKMLLR